MSVNDWIYFEGSEVLVKLDDFNVIEFTSEEGTLVMRLRDINGNEVVIDTLDDINNFRKNILKIGVFE